MKLTLNLTRPAKSRGGDRYESKLPGEDKPLVIYLPQSISRSWDNDSEEYVILKKFEMNLIPV